MKRVCMSVYGLWRYTYCDSLVFLLRKEAWFLENMIITANWVTTVYQTAAGNRHFSGCKYGPSVKNALSRFKGSSYCLSPSRVGFHSQLERVQRGLLVCARTATFQSSSWHCVYELPRAICGNAWSCSDLVRPHTTKLSAIPITLGVSLYTLSSWRWESLTPKGNRLKWHRLKGVFNVHSKLNWWFKLHTNNLFWYQWRRISSFHVVAAGAHQWYGCNNALDILVKVWDFFDMTYDWLYSVSWFIHGSDNVIYNHFVKFLLV